MAVNLRSGHVCMPCKRQEKKHCSAVLATQNFQRKHLRRCSQAKSLKPSVYRNKPRLKTTALSAGSEIEPLRFGPGAIKEIPVFPLGIVAFPTAEVPLNIFEARYRVLFNTLLSGVEGIDQDLVNEEKPWVGTRLFGLCYVNSKGAMATVGVTLHIKKHVSSADGRILVVNTGVEKFSILKVLEQRPIMICQVEILEDDDGASEETVTLARESVDIFKRFIELNIKVNKIPRSGELIGKVDEMTPREVSYWLAMIFAQNPYAQQALLEEKELKTRLSQEKQILESISGVLSAKLAVQSAFQEPSETGSQSEGPSGSDKPDSSAEQSPPAGPD